jgi:hypothetical protein
MRIVDVVTDPVDQVRAIWAAYARGGVDALRQVAPSDVEWVPLGAAGPSDEPALRAHVRDVSVTVHGYERHGSCVLAHGSLRTFREGGFIDVQPSWAYFFDADNRLRRCVGYESREAALRALSEFDGS